MTVEPSAMGSFYVAASHRPPPEFVEVARIVEELGFDGVSIADHLFVPAAPPRDYPYSPDGRPPFDVGTPWPDALILAAAAATVTRRLQFVTGVYILPLRHPLIVARAAATVEALAPGRLQLGVGVGWMREEFDAMQVDFAMRGALADEAIELLRKLWAGGLVHHDGPNYPLEPLYFEPHPTRPIPIFIGGSSRPALERAARHGNGYIATPSSMEDLYAVTDQVRRLRATFGLKDEPYSIRARPTDAVSADEYRRLLDAGIDSFVIPALSGTPSEVRAKLEQFAADVIEPLKSSGHVALTTA
jgi:probable F420-dependent oxidoreductase